MIESADEFIRLRTSEIKEEYDRSTYDTADISTWTELINNYPDYKQWVIHNKTVPIEILEVLTLDNDPNIRSLVARKRKINDKIFKALSTDKDENVRHSLIYNSGLTIEKLKQINTADSDWLAGQLRQRLIEIEK